MADLLEISSRIIDSGELSEPTNRITNELSEVADGLAMVESFSHSVVVDTGDGLLAVDTSHDRTGADVVEAIKGWSTSPVRHVVYTHGHADHVGGYRHFAAEYGELPVLGHRNVAARFDRYRDMNDWNLLINARQFGGVRQDFGMGNEGGGGAIGRFIPDDTKAPDVVVDDTSTQHVGDIDITWHHANAETDDHVWGWEPNRRWLFTGDLMTWLFPNAGNPQKVQRFPVEWATALRTMVELGPELLLPAHGLPIEGRERVATVLTDVASALEQLVDDVIAMMNAGETLDTIIHTAAVPAATLAKPYLQPLYDEPEFMVRAVWRQNGGWWDGAASRLKPAPDAQLAAELAALAGGAGTLAERAREVANSGDFRLASHLADLAGWAAPDDAGIHRVRAGIYRDRRAAESSLMAKGIFAGAARESEAIAGGDAANSR